MEERTWDVRGPLADSYPAAVALVVLALVPFLAVTAAIFSLLPAISHSTGLSRPDLDLTIAMSDAAYAVGTVIAVQLAVHKPGRRLLIVYVSVFIVAAGLAAWAPAAPVFVGAFVVEGMCTSLMLIAAVPPLVTGWPVQKMPVTGMIMNFCVFGAVALGPTIGSTQTALGGWRPLFVIVTAIGGLALLFAVLTFEDQPPQDPDAPWDVIAVALAAGGCGLAFFGAGELEARGAADARAIGPLVAGVAMIVALVVHQYRTERPLMPVKQLATTLPVAAIVLAMSASAAAFGLMELTLQAVETRFTPSHLALLFLPEFGAAAATALLFGALFRTRFTPLLALGGIVLLVAASALLLGVFRAHGAVVAAGAGLIGLGVGASVSPALFIAGFSLRSTQIQRVFALIELLRGVAAFLVSPVLVFVATAIATRPAAGTRDTVWVCLGIAAAGTLLSAAIFLAGGGGLQLPNLERWQHGEPAWDTPPLLARLRRRPCD